MPLVGVMLAVLPCTLVAQQASVTLQEAIRLAERVQPTVIQAQGTVNNAEAQIRSAKGAYLPSLTASSTGGTSFSAGPSRTNPVTGELINGNSSNTSVSMGLSSRVDLFTGFRRGADRRAANATRDAADAGLIDARSQVALTTTQTFFDALAAGQLARVREASVRRAEEQLKTSIAKLHSGSATRSDSLRSLVTLGTARVQQVEATTQLIQAEAELGRLVGANGQVSAVDDSAYYRLLPAVDSTAIREEAESASPQIRSADASANAARAFVSSSRSGYWPTLSLGGSTNWNGSNAGSYQLFNTRQLSLTMSWSIFNRFVREQNIAIRESSFDAAVATAANAHRQVQSSLTGQLALLDAAALRIEITTTSVQAAEEDLRVQNERYRVGAATIVDVLTSQEALTQAGVDAVNARFDYLRAKAQIEALIGHSL